MGKRTSTGVERWFDGLLVLAAAVLLVSVGVALAAAAHWPLVGDEALMHYVVLLLGRGWAPYRQIVDINLPGSYLLDALTMRLLGAGAGGLRMYDGLLCLVVCACCLMLGGEGWRGRMLGAMAGLVFVMIHLRDGLMDAGQRDLAMRALVLVGFAMLLRAPERWRSMALMGFEFLIGVTLIVKPTLGLMAFVPLLGGSAEAAGGRLTVKRGLGMAGMLLAPAMVTAVWLWRGDCLAAFLRVMASVGVAHNQVARQGMGHILRHALDPLTWLFVAVVVLGVTIWWKPRREERLLLLGLAAAAFSVVVQGKGFPYQRYPLLVLGLLVSFRMLNAAWAEGGLRRGMALALVMACAGVGWLYAREVVTYDRYPLAVGSLSAELRALHAGNGEVQCLDTVGGCVNALYEDGLTQATGYLYDCYAYVGADAQRTAYRADLARAIEVSSPKYLVFSSQFCLAVAGDFGRLERWPEMNRMVGSRYRLAYAWSSEREERWWSRRQLPYGYEVYVRR